MSGYPMIDALNATHPLTLREKVALKPCPFCGGSPEMEFSEFELHDGFHVVCVGDKNCPLYCSEPYRAHDTEKEAAEIWNRRTALAYGSGDHEELARLAVAATPGPWFETEGHPSGRAYGIHAEAATVVVFRGIAKPHGQGEHNAAFIAAANPATVLALLAENAALRTAVEIRGGHINRLIDRATEAERKLAEAVGLNDRAAELMRQCTDPERFEGASTLNVYANMRAWLSDLSKEAERG